MARSRTSSICRTGDRERRGRDRAEAGAGRDRAGQAQADREPRRLRLFSARHGELSSDGPGRPTTEALRLFYRAIELDPEFASAYGMAAWCYVRAQVGGWMTDRVKEIAEAPAGATGGGVGQGRCGRASTGGIALAYVVGDLEDGAAFIDRALAAQSEPGVGVDLQRLGENLSRRAGAAIEHFAHAMRLSPLDPLMFVMQNGIAFAHFFAGRYDEASSWAEKALREDPNYLPAVRVLAASSALAGRLRGGAERHGTPARHRCCVARIRSRGFDPTSPTGRCRQVGRGPAKSRAAGLARFRD